MDIQKHIAGSPEFAEYSKDMEFAAEILKPLTLNQEVAVLDLIILGAGCDRVQAILDRWKGILADEAADEAAAAAAKKTD